MNILNKIFYIFAAAMILAACGGGNGGKDEPDVPDIPDKPVGTTLNGTTINSSSNMYGLVKDSQTGKGIAGVPVTEGYNWTSRCLLTIRFQWMPIIFQSFMARP